MTRTTRRRAFRGQSMVEFALAAPVFFLLMLGTIEFGRLVWTNHELEQGTREALRYAVVHGANSGAPADTAAVTAVVLDKTAGISNSVVVACGNCGGARGSTVSVTTSYVYTPVFASLLGLATTITLNSQSQGVIHQ
jgi:Flp pilus assembly protein TadG